MCFSSNNVHKTHGAQLVDANRVGNTWPKIDICGSDVLYMFVYFLFNRLSRFAGRSNVFTQKMVDDIDVVPILVEIFREFLQNLMKTSDLPGFWWAFLACLIYHHPVLAVKKNIHSIFHISIVFMGSETSLIRNPWGGRRATSQEPVR